MNSRNPLRRHHAAVSGTRSALALLRSYAALPVPEMSSQLESVSRIQRIDQDDLAPRVVYLNQLTQLVPIALIQGAIADAVF